MRWLLRMFLLVVLSVGCSGGDETEMSGWTRFRGPNGSGVIETVGLPIEFGPEENVVWKVALPTGYSSPVLTESNIFLTAEEDGKLWTYCLDRQTGQTNWRREAPRPRQEKLDQRNHAAAASAALDRENVYVFFADFGLLAYDFAGNKLWEYPLGPFNNIYGMGASPVVVEGKVVLVCDQSADSFILALNKKDGSLAWRKDRPEAKSGHSTPIVYRPAEGGTQVIVPGSFLLSAYSVATGEKAWWVRGLSFEMKSTPVMSDEALYINGYASPLNQPENLLDIPAYEDAIANHDSNGDAMISKEEFPPGPPRWLFGFVDSNQDGQLDADDWSFFQAAMSSKNGMLGIKLGGEGDMTDTNLMWQYHRSVPQLPSPLLYKNVLYMINDGGIATSFNPANGEVIKQGRLKDANDQYYASPVAADDKVFMVSRRGKVSVLKPDGSLDALAVNDLGEQCYATPAIADGRIYLRTKNTLFCFGVESQTSGL